MYRFRYIEPFVMLATLLRWLFLASLTGIVVGAVSSIFLQVLFYSMDKSLHNPLWMQLLLLPLGGGLLNGLLIYYGYRNKQEEDDSVIKAVA